MLTFFAVLTLALGALPGAVPRERAGEGPPLVFRNTGPGVSYAGDAACAGCHVREAGSYPLTAMGRSFSTPERLLLEERLVPPGGVAFDHPLSGRRYKVAARDGVLTHTEVRLDEQRREAFSDTRPIAFVLGSGDRGQTFLTHQGGRLAQTAVALRRSRDGWGMAAGFERLEEYSFTRPVTGPCLFCHANRADYVEGTLNEYRQPVFDGLAIGCERCHGPGGLHVAERRSLPPGETGVDTSIVNPRRLPAALRDSVCYQCHLQGSVRIQKASGGLYGFRPGLPLSDFAAVYHLEKQAGEEEGLEVVSHVERLRESRCWKESGGGLSCLTCHDPHRTPRGADAARQFRSACLTCHAPEDCSGDGLHAAGAGPHPGGPDCAGCHMSKLPPSDAPHTLFTDHKIARRPPAAPAPPPRAPRGAARGLVSFLEPEGGSDRDRGVAYLVYAEKEGGPAYAERGAALLEPLLPALQDDFNALRLLAVHYQGSARRDDLARILERMVVLAPSMAELKVELGRAWSRKGRSADALRLLREAVREDPSFAPGRLTLGDLELQAGDPRAALAEHEAAARLDPSLAAAQARLGDASLRRGDARAAIGRYRTAVLLSPEMPSARWGLARSLALAGETLEAIVHLERLLGAAPDHEEGRALLDELRRP
ncbi:MAG TPA: tetratricopeptide repeat protein [Candidatus Polarisedimenticolia bacterium]|nr:tetratricopeptide repeat protein [Candidatus Polarisedimenticolia bacterium]